MYAAESHPEFYKEFIFNTSRSGGAGGQNVNKVSTKVELKFNVPASQLLREEEKALILEKLKNKINSEGQLIVVSQEARTQLQNKQNSVRKFFKLINAALVKTKPRKATKPTKSSVHERIKAKKKIGEKKAFRKFNNDPEA